METAHNQDRANPPPARRWPARLVSVGLVGAATVLVVLVAMMPKNEESVPALEIPPVNVKIEVVEAIPELADTFTLSAVVEPYCVVNVAAEVAGRIERFGQRGSTRAWRGRLLPAGSLIKEGEPIEQGDPIVYLNKELLQARFERTEAQFVYDQTEFERIADLYQRDVTSKTEYEDARTKHDVSKAVRDEAFRNLARAEIVAPISGILNTLPIELGEYASPGDEVAEIVNIDQVKVVVDVPEREVYYLNVGDSAEILAHVPQETSLIGKISYISELADADARTTRLEITVDNRDHQLRSGQIVRVRLVRRVLSDVIMIPLGSVIPLERGRVVYVVEGGQAQRRVVELGFIKGRSVQVLAGVEAGDSLIVAGHRYVGPGQPVNIVADERPAAPTSPRSSVSQPADSP